jgi:DNA-binding NarL/FixJ family response regulator
MARPLRDVIRETVSSEPDLDIVSEYEAGVDAAAVEQDAADVVLAGHQAIAQADLGSLLASARRPRVFELSSDGKDATVYELRVHRSQLGELSPAALVEAIRKSRSNGGA